MYPTRNYQRKGRTMDKQERTHESYKADQSSEQDDVRANPEMTEKGQRLKGEMDDLVDEIDKVLEENAAEFVKNYVQKGGE